MGIDQVAFVMVELPGVTSPEAALIGSDRKWRHRKWPWPIGLPEVMFPRRVSSDARMRNRKLGSLFFRVFFFLPFFFPFYHFLKKKFFIFYLFFLNSYLLFFHFFHFFFPFIFLSFFFVFFIVISWVFFFYLFYYFFIYFFLNTGKWGWRWNPFSSSVSF